MKRLAFLGLALLLTSGAEAAPVRTEVRFQPLANLVYQLDAVCGLLPGDTSDYQALWKKEFLKAPGDEAVLERWGTLRRRYRDSLTLSVEGEFPLERPIAFISPFDKLRQASFQSRSRDDFLERLELVLTPSDVVVADETLRRFEGPFRLWWGKEAQGRGKSFARALERLLARPDLSRRIEQFQAFYEARQPQGSVCSFNLIYRPEARSGSTNGQQIENYSVVEFLPGEKPQNRLDVVLHELCHYFYWLAPPGVRQKLQAEFLKSGHPGALPAFGLLNEGLATVLGNGILARSLEPKRFEKLLKMPLSLYNNEDIDRAGKALIAPMDRWLAGGVTLSSPTFSREYLQALDIAFGASLTAPRRFLTEPFVFVDGPLGEDVPGRARRILSMAGMYSSVGEIDDPRSFEGYADSPNRSALLIVRPESVPALAKRLGLPEVALQSVGLFGFRRGPLAIGIVLVASDAEQIEAQLKRLNAAPERFEGVL